VALGDGAPHQLHRPLPQRLRKCGVRARRGSAGGGAGGRPLVVFEDGVGEGDVAVDPLHPPRGGAVGLVLDGGERLADAVHLAVVVEVQHGAQVAADGLAFQQEGLGIEVVAVADGAGEALLLALQDQVAAPVHRLVRKTREAPPCLAVLPEGIHLPRHGLRHRVGRVHVTAERRAALPGAPPVAPLLGHPVAGLRARVAAVPRAVAAQEERGAVVVADQALLHRAALQRRPAADGRDVALQDGGGAHRVGGGALGPRGRGRGEQHHGEKGKEDGSLHRGRSSRKRVGGGVARFL
jgi:hypothetical protein